MKIRIEPYKMWSGGAKALGECVGILRATKRQVAKHGDFDVVINWGNSVRRFNGQYINDPDKVANASDKLLTAKIFEAANVPQPDYTSDMDTARSWIADGSNVVCRTLLRANSGRGILLAGPDGGKDIVRAPLYTKYIKKTDEYRIHVAFGKVIDVQMKKKRQEVPNEEVNYQIRNASNGWVFCRDGINCPAVVGTAALAAVTALGLDFGACDIGFNAKRGAARVYEVNTAPGLEGSTLDSYYGAFTERYPALRTGAYSRRRAAA